VTREEVGSISERRVVAVLFADIVDFTAMTEHLDPEQVTDAMNEIFAFLGAEVERVGGHVDKVVGDNLMALFGAPVAHEDDPLRAVRAALAMHAATDARQDQLKRSLGGTVRLRIGIHSGQVVWGSVGPPGHTQPTVMGDVVNLASRLQRAAPNGGVLISEPVARQVRGTFLCKPWEPIIVKGKSDPVAVYEVMGERKGTEPTDRPPFVDRQQDLEQLADLFARARRGRAQVVIVTGDPGIGKTRLVEEFIAQLPGDVSVLQTTCPPYGGQSVGPLSDLFRQFAGLRGPVTLEEVEAKIPLGPRAAQAAIILSRLFALAETPAGHAVSQETALLVAAEVIRLMLTQPTVVWIEDLQWADTGTREVLPVLVERLSETPLFLVGTLRSGEEPLTWGKRTSSTLLPLDPLSAKDAAAFVAGVLGEPLPRDVERVVLEKAAGNPFYLNEIVATLRGTGRLVLDDRGHWRAAGSVEDVLPDTVQATVLARLDRLPPDLRNLFQRASVVGTSFTQSLLAALASDSAIAEPLQRLEDANLIRRHNPFAADPEYVFIHPLVREAAYTSLLTKHQVALHRKVAEAMERLHADQLDDLAKTIGTHYARGGAPQRALPYLIQAGEQAAHRYATRDAIELLETAHRLCTETGQPELCVPVCELLGDLYLRVHDRGPKDWHDVWEFARTHTDPAVEPVRWARAAIRVANAQAIMNQVEDAQVDLQAAERLIPPNHALWSDFHRVRALILIQQSAYREALDEARTAVDIANRIGTLDDRFRAYAVLAHPAILPLLGDAGRTIMRQAVADAAASGDERLLIEARHFLLSDVWTRGIVDADLLHTAHEALHKSEEHGWTRDEATLCLLLGWSYFLTGQWGDAGRYLQRTDTLLDQHHGGLHGGFQILVPYFKGNLVLATGRVEEARRIFADALPHARFHAPIWLNHDLARCLAILGRLDEARGAMEHALAARDKFRCIICGCQANGVAAEFYATLGDAVRAGPLISEAEETARDIGHVTTRIRVRRGLARLAQHGGRPQEAVTRAREALTFSERLPLPQPFERGQSLLLLGELLESAGQRTEAIGAWREAKQIFADLGAAHHLGQATEALARIGSATS